MVFIQQRADCHTSIKEKNFFVSFTQSELNATEQAGQMQMFAESDIARNCVYFGLRGRYCQMFGNLELYSGWGVGDPGSN